MLILHIALTPLAGAPIRIINAINAHTKHTARFVNFGRTYGSRTFPEDLLWSKDRELVLELLGRADILHFHHYMDVESENNPFEINFRLLAPKAKFLRHYHTDLAQLAIWNNIDKNIMIDDIYPKVVIPHCPERTFLDAPILPNILPINATELTPKIIKNKRPIVAFSSSSISSRFDLRWNTKGYHEVSKKLKELSTKLDFEYIEIINTPYLQAMEIKRQADIVVGDIVTGSYHLTELEGISQGKVVLTYLDARSVQTFMNTFKCTEIPFVNTELEYIEPILKELVKNNSLREEIGNFSRAWMEKYYNDNVLVQNFIRTYEKLLSNESLTRTGSTEYPTAKDFLYNTIHDIKWEQDKQKAHNLQNKTIRKRIKRVAKNIFSIRKNDTTKTITLFGMRIKIPRKPTISIAKNHFVLWEPCTGSHGEVVPGFAKYLLDLGYTVSVIISNHPNNKGLFARVTHPKLKIISIKPNLMWKNVRRGLLKEHKNILVTTARTIQTESDYHKFDGLFSGGALYVEHDIKSPVNENYLRNNTITLAKMAYKDAKTIMINPHYFGEISIHPKNMITNFVLIGALEASRRNIQILIEAVKRLCQTYKNFRIIVIGSGNLEELPEEITPYFEIKGRLSFDRMYEEIDRADFLLILLDPKNKEHERYISTGVTGSTQLVYGFIKPCIIHQKFSDFYGFTEQNSVVYEQDLEVAMANAIDMKQEEYSRMQDKLQNLADTLYDESLANLKRII